MVTVTIGDVLSNAYLLFFGASDPHHVSQGSPHTRISNATYVWKIYVMDTYEEKPPFRFETIILEKGVLRLYVSLFRFYVEQTRDETP